MIDQAIEKQNIKEKIRLDKSYINYHKIIDKQLPYKFAYLDEWLLKQSRVLMKETEFITNSPPRLKTYKRGTIVKVDFGVGLGSEMSQIHFAIVLNKYDNPKNNVLTVLPLTSKPSNFNTYLGTLIIDLLIEKLEKEIEDLSIEKAKLKDRTKINKINTLLSYYKSNIKSTYACCSLITTISKSRIFLPINEYDIIGKARCSPEIMNRIDEELKNRLIQ